MTIRRQTFLAGFILAIAPLAWGKVGIPYWKVEDLRPGMKGYGLTVIRGEQPQRFLVSLIDIVKNSSPGRDIVLCRVEGLGLERSGIVAGMSGSPVYVDDKLVGAIAFTWSFGKDPIGGITPFAQMAEFSQSPKVGARRGLAEVSLLLDAPLPLPVRPANPASLVGAGPVPVSTPVAVAGLGPWAIEELSRRFTGVGMVPVAVGGKQETRATPARLEPGSAMGVALVAGDVSMSAIGTVTAIDDKRIYGFGHPFLSAGRCDLPLQTATIHALIPLQTVGFKLGSPLDFAGRLDVDASTCVAGNLGEKVSMLPVSIHIRSDVANLERHFECRFAREPSLLGTLTFIVLGNCLELDGQPQSDLTVRVRAKLDVEGEPALELADSFAGVQFTGPMGLMRAFQPVANLVNSLANNPIHRPRIRSLSVRAEVSEVRRLARIVEARLARPVLRPGEVLRARVWLQPFSVEGSKLSAAARLREMDIELPVPIDLEPGKYTALVGDQPSALRAELQNRPHLLAPSEFRELYELLQLQLGYRRTDIVLRLDLPRAGVAHRGLELPNLPGGIVDVFRSEEESAVSTFRDGIVARQPTDWVIEGSTTVHFEVVKERKFAEP